MKHILLIGFGGFIGSVARYYISRINLTADFLSLPLGTLIVNVLGSLILGFLTGIAERSILMNVELRLFLMIGLCGGFTTFSTFAGENLMLMRNGQFGTILLYTGLSVFFGFMAVYLGYISTKLL
ncbi:MAG: fluoride efflux transporter CrcB [Bacteroidales bacterium]|nr:fluoride efflux transporter CrcB [Bacteroidales bacterium]